MYEIPKNLNKYEDEFIPVVKWNFRQFMYFLVLLGTISALYHFINASLIIKLCIIIPLSIVSITLIHMKFDERLTAWLNLKNSLRNIGYYDPQMDKFIPISSIKDNTIYLKNGILMAIIEVKPIDFSILGDAEKEDVLFNYRGFLKSLEHPLQICCRSAEVNFTEWLSNLKGVVVNNNNTPTSLERIESLTKWIEKEISETNTRNRLFYIVVPYRDFSQQKTFTDSMKELFFYLFGKEVIFSGKRKEQYEKSLKEVSNRVEDVVEKITKTGVKAKRMNSNQLLSLYTTYFTDLFEIDTSYLSPVMWLKSSHDKALFKKFTMKKVYEKITEYDPKKPNPILLDDLNIDDISLFNEIIRSEGEE
ncbi:MAG: hypothetical protein U9O94_07925 [Nanoarchaeota archaeon]|nr:hypothetical protein [Nanoarchaeota archaeon]